MNNRSFDDILKEKLQDRSPKQQVRQTSRHSQIYYPSVDELIPAQFQAHFFQRPKTSPSRAFLLYEHWQVPQNPSSQEQEPSFQVTPEPEANSEPQVAKNELTPSQLQAFEVLQSFGASLDECFTASALKKAFRQLAKTYHPDTQGAQAKASHLQDLARKFQRINSCYKTLKTAFEKNG